MRSESWRKVRAHSKGQLQNPRCFRTARKTWRIRRESAPVAGARTSGLFRLRKRACPRRPKDSRHLSCGRNMSSEIKACLRSACSAAPRRAGSGPPARARTGRARRRARSFIVGGCRSPFRIGSPPAEDAVSARRPSGGSGGPRRPAALARHAEEAVARGSRVR